MKKVYAVYHVWDQKWVGYECPNYEEEYKLFSSYDLAERHYYMKTYGNTFEGRYELITWELDTNVKLTILATVCICTEDSCNELEDHDNYDDCDYSYHDWFHDTFMHDYDLALLEVEKKKSYEQWILKQSRNAARSNADMSKAWWAFLNKYPLTLAEQCDFWDEYYTTKYQDTLYYNLKH